MLKQGVGIALFESGSKHSAVMNNSSSFNKFYDNEEKTIPYTGEYVTNLQMELNLIHYSYLYNVKKLVFLASSCIYPKFAPQPLKEEYLFTGILEPTNEPYSVAKLAGLKMCEAYMSQYGAN